MVAFSLLLLGGTWIVWTNWSSSENVSTSSARPVDDLAKLPRNVERGVAFVGDESCARCHSEITESFSLHPMGRSMTTPDRIMPNVSGQVFQVGDLRYSIEHQAKRVVHREERLDPSGKVLGTTEGIVSYVIGSGVRGYSFLVERQNELYQSPIAWFTQGRKWDLAPGYREHNLHFDRAITKGCLFCHANRTEKVAGKSTVFHGLAIGCERCHGPGQMHEKAPEVASGERPNIVNPAKLDSKRRDNVCEQCHLQGVERSDLYPGSLDEYRPGLSLERFVNVLGTGPPPPGPGRRFRAVGHVEQMRLSRCYRASEGALGCISCHDPHRTPDLTERTAYYQGRCLACHADKGCRLDREARLAQSPADDCVFCHMPSSGLANVAHTVGVDHSIPKHSR